MLPKQFRLKNNKAFEATYFQRKVIANELLIMYLGKEKKELSSPTKFGFVVSKKFHKRAVKRNRVKRLLRECIRLSIKDNNLKNLNKYMSVILIPKANSNIYSAKRQNVQEKFEELLVKVK
jgi:ribonuclease P protein component